MDKKLKVIAGVIAAGVAIGGAIGISRSIRNSDPQQTPDSYLVDNIRSEKAFELPGNLEQYLGKTIDVLSTAVGAEPDVTMYGEGQFGYPEFAFFEYEWERSFYGSLTVDPILSKGIHDSTLYISSISIGLPYENIAGLEKNDDAETVKSKIVHCGLSYEVVDDHIDFEYGRYKYSVYMYGENNTADQIMMEILPAHRRDEETFNRYVEKLTGGYILDNGDYLVITEDGLIQIFRNSNGLCYISSSKGTLEETEEGILYTSDTGRTKYLIHGDGSIMQLPVPPSESDSQTLEQGQTSQPEVQAPAEKSALDKYKDAVRVYMPYALDKFDYVSKRFYSVADLTHDGIPELYTIHNKSSPNTYGNAELKIFTLKDGEVKFLESFIVSEPRVSGGTEFTNYYMTVIPGEGAYLIEDRVNTRLGTGHYVIVFYLNGDGSLNIVDSVEFAYPNTDLECGYGITDFPRAQELLEKYSVCYDNLLFGLDHNHRLYFGNTYASSGDSYQYLQYLISGEKDDEIKYVLTGELP